MSGKSLDSWIAQSLVLTKKEKIATFWENRYVTVILFDFSLRIMDLGLGFDDEDFESKKQSGQDNKKSYNAKFCSEYVSIKGYFFKGCIEW